MASGIATENFLGPESEGTLRNVNDFRDDFEEAQQRAEELVNGHLPSEIDYVDGNLFRGDVCSYVYAEIDLKVQIDLRGTFPMFQHEIANKTVSRKKVDAMRAAARSWVSTEKDQVCMAGAAPSLLDIAMVILRLIEMVTGHIQELQEHEKPAPLGVGWNAQNADALSLSDIIRNQHGINLRTVRDVTSHIIGQTIQDISQGIQPLLDQFRVVHFEPVLRADLTSAFLQRQADMRSQLEQVPLASLRKLVPHQIGRRNDRAAIIDELVRPRLTFHGTRKAVVRDIVRFGFLKPGDVHPRTGEQLPVRCGSTYGRGIYSSPNAAFAMQYAGPEGTAAEPAMLPGMKLIVCAVLMGRSAHMFWEDNWREQSKPYVNADSHVGNDGFEYIVFDSAQILPCYVLHLDWTEAHPEDVMDSLQAQIQQSKSLQRTHRKFKPELFPGEKQRLKEERLARARKFFAYGFGPVSGNKIIIEDIADTDDDEEEYGEYQGDRLQGEVKERSVWDWNEDKLDGETQFDEYADARKAWRKVGRAERG